MLTGSTVTSDAAMDVRDGKSTADTFNLSIEEVRIIVKYRALAEHQRRGVLQAFERLKPSQPRALWRALQES